MPTQKSKPANVSQSTQIFLDIAEIKNDAVIMKDGTLRAVLLVSSVNFALKSDDEQNALVSAYVTFLNYLDFPIQIVIQSRKLNIDNYLKRLESSERELTNELLKRQIVNYKEYIKELVELGDIMTKRFFIAVPYSPFEDKKRGFLSKLSAVFTPAKIIQLKQEKFDKYLYELNQRVEHVNMNISGLGLTVVRLDTQSLIELYYGIYNPKVSESEKLADMEKLNVEA
ncbi:MAG: hypothetical protein V1928_03525 [Parcubacteria group bacterium]